MKHQRRDFLKTAAALGSGLFVTSLAGKLAGCSNVKSLGSVNKNFGLQLYTLREDFPKDPKGVLRQVASYGYKQIESFEGRQGMFWGMTNKEFKDYLDSLDMKIVSSHCNWAQDFQRKADEAAAIGMSYLIAPYLGPQKTLDAYRAAADKFNECGRICKERGLRFAYHNHDYTFVPTEGQLPQDVMMERTDKDLVDYQMDIYWVVAAGQDPVAWINKYPGRFKLCHVKDRERNAGPADKDASTVLGTGGIDFPTILKAAEKDGMKFFIVEQEAYKGTTPLKAVEANAAYMKNLSV